LARGPASDPAFREKIYGSAAAALERALQNRPLDHDDAAARRLMLAEAVQRIEDEIAMLLVGTGPAAPEVSAAYPEAERAWAPAAPVQRKQAGAHVRASWPSLAGKAGVAGRLGTVMDALGPVAVSIRVVLLRVLGAAWQSRRLVSWALSVAFLLGMMLLGFWVWNEALRIYAAATSETPPGRAPALSEPGQSTAGTAESRLTVFEAGERAAAGLPEGLAAAIVEHDGAQWLSLAGVGEFEVQLDAAALQRFAGRRVLFSMIVRNASGEPLEMGVRCDFGAQADCERKRFRLTTGIGEYMFALTFGADVPDRASIFLTPDLSAKGLAVELQSIRIDEVAPAPG
jgi:hypothetical protein